MTSTVPVKTVVIQRWKSLDESWRFAIVAFVAIRLCYAIWSLVILTIQPLAIQNIVLSEEPILTVFDLQDSHAYTYLRDVHGQVLTFRVVDPSRVEDLQTGSIWDISTGMALQGQYQGFKLL